MENPNYIVPDRPAADSTNAAANTRFVTTAVAGVGGLTVGSTTITGGTSGKVLFDNAGVVGEETVSGALVSVVAYSSSQTITIPTGATKAFVRMWGGSGGSGGVDTNASSTTGSSGAGAYLEKYLTGLTAGNTLAYTNGGAGAAGTSGGGNGGNGTASSLASGTQVISTLTANGSNGSLGATAGAVTASTAGGTATGGDFNAPAIKGGNAASGVSPGIAGMNLYSPGAHGIFTGGAAAGGNAGNAGGMIIFWFT